MRYALLALTLFCAQAPVIQPPVVTKVNKANGTVTVRAGRQAVAYPFNRLIVLPRPEKLPPDFEVGEEVQVEKDGRFFVVRRLGRLAEQEQAARQELPEEKREAINRARAYIKRKAELHREPLHPKKFKTGDIGTLPYDLWVLQVLDKTSMRVKVVGDSMDRWTFITRDISTQDIVDETETKLSGLFEVKGTTTYRTALGSKTVFLLARYVDEKAPAEDLAELEKFEAAQRAKQAAEIEAQKKALGK